VGAGRLRDIGRRIWRRIEGSGPARVPATAVVDAGTACPPGRCRYEPRKEIFSDAARRRAAQVMAERGQHVHWGHTNGHTTTLTIDQAKLARFEPARSRLPSSWPAAVFSSRKRVEKREILSVKDLAIHFGGVHALDGVRLTARTAEIAGVIGPNGAGKTTFFNCLSGLLTPDRGDVAFDGQPLPRLPRHPGRRGLGRTFQTPRLFGSLTVLDNLIFGCRTADSAQRQYVFDPALRRLSHFERAERIARMVGFRASLFHHSREPALRRSAHRELARALCGRLHCSCWTSPPRAST